MNRTKELTLVLSINDWRAPKWNVETYFPVNEGFPSHLGEIITLGKGSVVTSSSIKKINTRSFTDVKFVGVDSEVRFKPPVPKYILNHAKKEF